VRLIILKLQPATATRSKSSKLSWRSRWLEAADRFSRNATAHTHTHTHTHRGKLFSDEESFANKNFKLL
jgi:hypothetical protein